MIHIEASTTIDQLLLEAASRYGDAPLLMVPANEARDYAPAGLSLSYAEVAEAVGQLRNGYARAGYGEGHRIGLLLENRPEHFLHKLAMNALGACCVPLNPDHRPAEMAYVIGHARLDLVIVIDKLADLLQQAIALGSTGLRSSRSRRRRRPCRQRARRRFARAVRPTALPASSTPRVPPGAPRAACCRTATRSQRVTGMPPRAGW